MVLNKNIGKHFENVACTYLINRGYQILEINWRYRKAEIDIICKKDEMIVFVEVKSRSNTFYGAPETQITAKKEILIIDAAQRYMDQIGHEWEIRFDIISIVFNNVLELVKLNHFKDAFFY